MKKFFKIFGITVLVLFVLVGGALGLFVYKVKYGFPVSYETEPAEITIPSDRTNVILFSKATGFRHEESIEAGKQVFEEIAADKGWFLYNTEDAGVFNQEQLSQFDAVIFNNSTGRVLTDEQREILQNYVENGGKLIGIHGAGDDSHNWDWYEKNFLGARFSHHPLDPQLQEANIQLNTEADSVLTSGLSESWDHTDEWYVFFENPGEKGFEILYQINGDKIISNGNILWTKDKDFGMGKVHPVAWYRDLGQGKTFYTSIGHNAVAWGREEFVQMLVNAIEW